MDVSNAMHFLFDVMKPSYNYSGTRFNSHFEKSSVRYRCYGKLYAMSFNFNACIVCGKDDADGLSNVQRGIQAVLDYTELYSVDRNHQLVNHLKTENAGVKIHRHCQKNLNRSLRKRKCSNECESNVPKKTRKQTGEFTWKEHCFYRGGQCDDVKHPDRKSAYRIVNEDAFHRNKSMSFRENLLGACNARKDEWAESVKCRLVNCSDLVSVKARYHIACRDNFNLITTTESFNLSVNSAEISFVNTSLNASLDSSLNVSFLKPSSGGRPLDNTNFTQDDGDDDVTIGWYVDNAHLPIETHIPTYCNVIVSTSRRRPA